MQRALVLLASLVGLGAVPVTVAMADNRTNAAPPAAEKEGEIAGDPRGAIRALGGTNPNGYRPDDGTKVDVPKLGGGADVGRGGIPAGTTGPR